MLTPSADRRRVVGDRLHVTETFASASTLRVMMPNVAHGRSRLLVWSLVSVILLASGAGHFARLAAASSSIVISEFRVRGPNGGSDEFIELYNLSSAPVNIGGWKIKGSNNAGTT